MPAKAGIQGFTRISGQFAWIHALAGMTNPEVTLRQVEIARDQVRNAFAGFFRIMELWGADNAQARAILGLPAERTFYKWRNGDVGAVPGDVLRRIGYISGIWKALQILYSDHVQADGWVRRPNRNFGGQTPLERMSAGDVTDLAAVRQYLDAARGPWS